MVDPAFTAAGAGYIAYEVNFLPGQWLHGDLLQATRMDNNGAGLMLAIGVRCLFVLRARVDGGAGVAAFPILLHAVLMTYSRWWRCWSRRR
jgi:hypothetical protein